MIDYTTLSLADISTALEHAADEAADSFGGFSAESAG
jgi:hypothetical protein